MMHSLKSTALLKLEIAVFFLWLPLQVYQKSMSSINYAKQYLFGKPSLILNVFNAFLLKKENSAMQNRCSHFSLNVLLFLQLYF